MPGITDRTVITQISATFTATNTKMPTALAVALARSTRLTEAARTLAPPEGAIGVAVTTAIDDGRDPSTDAEVRRLLAATALGGNHNLPDQIAGAATEQVRDICRERADQIVGIWSKPFDQSAAVLVAAHQRIGPVPLDDTASIMQRGGDIASVWATARDAVATIDATVAGWAALATFTRLVTPNPHRRVLHLAAVDYPTWVTLQQTKLGPWDALLVGLTLGLPTFAEYRGRVATIERGEQEPVTVVDTERSSIAGRTIRVPAA